MDVESEKIVLIADDGKGEKFDVDAKFADLSELVKNATEESDSREVNVRVSNDVLK